MSASNSGSASNRYLSKYSVAIWPERNVKVPVSRAIVLTRWARESGGIGHSLGASVTAHQHLLGNRGHVRAISGEDVADGQTSPTDEALAAEVVKVPVVGASLAMEPHRWIQR